MAGLIEIRVPDMGDFKDVAIIDVLVKEGDSIDIDTPLITLETDKATMDVPASAAGVIEKLHVAKGGKISPGDLVVTVRGAAPAQQQAGSEASAPSAPMTAPPAQAADAKADVSETQSAPATKPQAEAKTSSAPAAAAAAAPAKKGPAGSVIVKVPDMGDFKDVAVIDVLVKPGDTVEIDTPLATLETDKATMDIPSSAAGTVETVHLSKGGKISPGDPVVTLRTQAGAAAQPAATDEAPIDEPSAPPPAQMPQAPQTAAAPSESALEQTARLARPAPPPPEPPTVTAAASRIPDGRDDLPPIDEPGFSRAHAGPSVRKLAREMGVDLSRVRGSGLKGRISHEDVKAYVKQALSGGASTAGASALPAVPQVDFAKFGAVEIKPLSRIQKIAGARLHASWVNLPHVTQFEEADISALEDVRTKLKQKALKEGIKLTPLAFVVRACVKALQEFPQFNASLDATGQNLVFKKYFHIGFAADTPTGLVVPVLKDVERCDIYEIARKLAELAEKARAGKLAAAEMQGGSFTISSLGGIGGTAFTPIINAPEVAILGVSRSSMKPVFENGSFVPRLMLPLSLSYDHRVIDGAAAARFVTFLAQVLADTRALTEAVP